MTEGQIIKIRRFLADKEMSATIKEILCSNFLKKKENDVHILAAQTLAVQSLEDAWKELERYRLDTNKKSESINVGV